MPLQAQGCLTRGEPMSALCASAMNPLYEQMKTSVFERMSGLAAKHDAVNLGQGFPDFGWPPEILEAAAEAVVEAISNVCRTGKTGDGKIFLAPVGEAVRIRTRESGAAAA